jgi:hypothetical protein
MKNKTIAVWFSCGVASAVATKKTIELYGKNNVIRVLNNPVLEEDSDNLRFLKEVEQWIGIKIESVVNPNFVNNSAVDVWYKRKYMSGIGGAPCTLELKKNARYLWEKNNPVDYHVLGFTLDELDRHKRFILNERDNVLPVLIDLGITKDMCFDIIKEAGIKRPSIYEKGFPNANCIGCVKATSPSYWSLVREHYPDVFNSRALQSYNIGCKLVRYQGKRISLMELPLNIERKRKLKNTIECGIFCEEKK